MQSIRELTDRVQHMHRTARALLDSKGSRRWSPAEQAAFDHLIDDGESAQEQLEATNLVAHHSRSLMIADRAGLDRFIHGAADVRNHSAVTGAQGGYLVGTFLAGPLVSQLKDYGAIRRNAGHLLTTRSGANVGVPTSDGTAEVGEIVAENVLTSALEPTFGLAAMPSYKFSSKRFTVPIELLQDSAIDMVDFITRRAIARIGRSQNNYFTTGTGTNQPIGIAVAAGLGKVGLTGQLLNIVQDDLIDLVDSVDPIHLDPEAGDTYFGTRPGWMMSQDTRRYVRRIKDADGRPIWIPGLSTTAGVEPSQLLDFPVYLNNSMPSPAPGARSIVFGNLRSYVVRDSLEFTLQRYDDAFFALSGQVGFCGWARAGANLTDPNAVKAYQHSAT